jgi:hypothetical protein
VSSQQEREVRAAQNELVFRAVNEQIMRITDRLRAQLADIDIVCECADIACVSAIRVKPEEFAAFERSLGTFLVVPGHEDEDVEQVLERRERYVVVLKPILARAGNGLAPRVNGLAPR